MTISLNRRQVMTTALAAGAAMSLPSGAAATGPSLNDLARQSGRRFGSCVGTGRPGTLTGTFADPAYRDLLVAECGLLVAENEMKWGALRPSADLFSFDRAEILLNFAKEKGLAFRGHTLLWHHVKWLPAWLNSHDFGADPVKGVEKMLTDHVAMVAGSYKNRITSWDVVNEAVDADTGLMRETAFTRHVPAETVLDITFHKAREVLPQGQLVYNDYMSWEPGHAKHRDGVLRLLEGFRKRGTPVDALGVQSHIMVIDGGPRYEEAAWKRFIDEVVGMGYGLLITEFDVNDKGLPGDIVARDQGVADYARAYLDMMLSYKQTGDVLAWGMVDKYSWLQGFTPRTDKKPQRCCPYDENFQPKPLREAIAASLRGAVTRG
ncbi:glycosyl hydrolase [Niveispirillum lacus]|uniref:Beta-xylanase n=1 Tax=Niveispirillum lacus TaxID=1981099 RepID=A0A255Z3W5_9PROT|nr:endo-1,4-beta-xylanase [Niveispirillum lacus]OYQ36168.1 glycosyl hydrolase [Niveispirillum lacus]